jgi:hypothetical protein
MPITPKTGSKLHAETHSFAPKRPAAERRRQVILDTIRNELGDDEFERLVAIAKQRHPEAFAAEVLS